MAQGAESTLTGGRYYPTKMKHSSGEEAIDLGDFDTTTCSGNLVIADGTVGGDERKVAEGANYKNPGG